MSEDVRLSCGCWGFCDLSCAPDVEDLTMLDVEEGFYDPRNDYDPEDIPGSRFDPECEDDPM